MAIFPVVGPDQIPRLAVSVFFGLVAAWVVYVRPRSSVNRSLAVLLVAVALERLVPAFATGAGQPADAWGRMDAYFEIAIPFAVLYFAHSYRRASGRAVRRSARTMLLVCAGAVALLWMARAARLPLVAGTDPPAWILIIAGPAGHAAMVAAAAIFVSDYLASAADHRRPSLLLAAMGLALLPTALSTGVMVNFVTSYALAPITYASVEVAAIVAVTVLANAVVMVLSGWMAVTLWRSVRRIDPAGRIEARRAARFLVAAAATGAAGGYLAQASTRISPSASGADVFGFILSFWALSFPLLLSYALLKYQLFGIDLRVRWGIQQGLVAGVFVLTFFVISEGIEWGVQSQTNSAVWGVVAAGSLLFVLRPLERWAHRVAIGTLPRAEDTEMYFQDRRRHLFHSAVLEAYADGEINERGRRMLEDLAQRLQIAEGEARKLERDVRRAAA